MTVTAPRIPIEQYFGAPAFENPDFSPGGKRSAVIANTAKTDLLLVFHPETQQLGRVAECPANYILKWAA